MQPNIVENIAKKSIEFVEGFVASLSTEDESILPPIFSKKSSWICLYDKFTIGIFKVLNDDIDKIKSNVDNKIQAFPGFYLSESNGEETTKVAIKQEGSCNYFSSNHTSNNIAYSIGPGSSCTVVNHFHEIKDLSGQEYKYQVDLAFLFGFLPNENWQHFKKRLSELLNHSLEVWRSLS